MSFICQPRCLFSSQQGRPMASSLCCSLPSTKAGLLMSPLCWITGKSFSRLLFFTQLFRVDPTAVPNSEGHFKWKPLLCAAMWQQFEVLQEFGKQNKPSWNVDSYGENILTLLLNDDVHGECPEVHDKRKKCLLWLKDEIDPDLGSIVNTIGSSGSSALSLAGQFDWGGPGLVEDSTGPIGCPTGPVGDPIGPVRGPTGPVGGPTGNEAKDQMIGWLLGMGADITLMDLNDAEAYLDR